MATGTAPGEIPRSTSRYRILRGKSISSPRVLDIFHDSDKTQESPFHRLRSSSVHSLLAGKTDKSAPAVPPLPSYALTPKPINIPPPPGFTARTTVKRPEQAVQPSDIEDVDEKYHDAPYEDQPATLQRTRSKSKRLGFSMDMLDQESASDASSQDAEALRIIEAKKQDLVRLQATLITPPPKAKTSLLSLFSRSKKLAPPTPTITHPDTPSSVATTVFSSRGNSLETSSNPDSIKYSDLLEKTTATSTPTPTLTPVSQTQLSIERVSAVNLQYSFTTNKDMKRVAVRCQSSTINLPVTLETNSVDILFMASTMMRHRINPAASVVVESYLMLGLERRLRRYERICDVMNSWDKDHENSLLILACPASMSDYDLDIDAVPKSEDPPAGFTMQIYHSSRPGKWNKRWITLMNNGQMYAAKSADVLPNDPNNIQLCHMAEFDIYSPKEAEIRRSVKPPKQFCYALKSQHRSMMFPDEDNFVHFFSIADEDTATKFYEAVHGWRSWHLVSRKLALDRKMNAPPPQITFDSSSSSDTSGDDSKDDSEPSSVSSSLRIGSFQPLLDIDNISKLAKEAKKRLTEETKRPVTSDGARRPPAPDFPLPATPAKPIQSSKSHLDCTKTDWTSPSQIYHSSPGPQINTRMDALPDSPLTNSSSLGFSAFEFDMSESKPEPKSWFPSATEHTAKLRKEAPPLTPLIRRPATADPSMQGGQRRQNPLLSVNTNFLEPPRLFANHGGPLPRGNSEQSFIYKLPGTPMTPSPPKVRSMPRSATGHIGLISPPSGMRPRSRSTASTQRRFPLENLPPVPPLPNRSMRRDAPVAPPMPAPLSVAPRYPPPRSSPLQPFPERD